MLAKHANARGPGGMLPRKILKIDALRLHFKALSVQI